MGLLGCTCTYLNVNLSESNVRFSTTCHVHIVDETPPTPNCPDDMVETVESGVYGKRVTFDLVTATDNSGNALLVTHSPVSGSLFPVGSTPVIFIFTDMAGNQASCFFLVNVTEGEAIENLHVSSEIHQGTCKLHPYHEQCHQTL